MAGAVSFANPRADITNAYDTAELGAARQAGAGAASNVESLAQNLGQFGGGAFDTGASKAALGDIYAKSNQAISNIAMGFAVQKEQAIRSSDQFLQNMAAQGTIDPTTGNFLKSQFAMNTELANLDFQHKMELLTKQQQISENQAMWGGIGQIGGMAAAAYFNPLGTLAGLAGKGAPGKGVSGPLDNYNPKVTL